MSGTFTVDIDDDGCASTALDLTAGITTGVVNGRVTISVVTHFALTNGHGIYYADTSDVPESRAAYFDIPTRSLTLVGEL